MSGWPRARLALALAAAALALPACERSAARPPDVVLIVIDTLRADRVSCYGYGRATTPNLDALAARGIRYANAFSTSSWTVPAHASFFTGLYPIEHGATQEHRELSPGPATLAELLSARGYATLGVSANTLVSERTGLSRGFERFIVSRTKQRMRAAGARHPNLVAVEEVFADLPADRPFFLFVNFIEPHAPYRPPEPQRSRFLPPGADPERIAAAADISLPRFYLDRESVAPQELALASDLYDGEVAFADALLGELLDWLERAGRLERALVIATSDHGENLGERGQIRHVFTLSAATVRIPLVVVPAGAGRAGERVATPVGPLDVFSTILAAAGVEPPPSARAGRDLLGAALEPAPLFSEYYYPLQALAVFGDDPLREHAELRRFARRLRSVQEDGMRLVAGSDGSRELYDVARDPAEEEDLSRDPAFDEREGRLAERLERFAARAGPPRPLPQQGVAREPFGALDAESAAELRELGYVR
jgi:arylsulfatase A-like enzyme